MRRNQLAVLGKGKGKDAGFHCVTAVSSITASRRPEEKKEGKVGERKGVRRTAQCSHFLLRSQHPLQLRVDG